jgi:hypothetical protein
VGDGAFAWVSAIVIGAGRVSVRRAEVVVLAECKGTAVSADSLVLEGVAAGGETG